MHPADAAELGLLGSPVPLMPDKFVEIAALKDLSRLQVVWLLNHAAALLIVDLNLASFLRDFDGLSRIVRPVSVFFQS